MINEQIKKYIQDESQKGSSREDITKNLVVNGWNISDVEQAFSELNINQPQAPSPEVGANIPSSNTIVQDQGTASSATIEQGSNKTIIGLFLGVIGILLFWIPAIGLVACFAGLGFCITSLKKENNKPGLAITGIVIGALALVLNGIVLVGEIYVSVTGDTEFTLIDKKIEELENKNTPKENTAPSVIVDSPEKTALIKEIVEDVKREMEFPVDLGDGVIMTDVTDHVNAIRYHYTTEDVTAGLQGFMKSILIDELCGDPDIKNLFDGGINLEYSYTNRETRENVLIVIRPNDCPSQ